MNVIIDYINTPLGLITVGATDKGLRILFFDTKKIDDFKDNLNYQKGKHKVIEKLKTQLEEYFYKKRTAFDIELDLAGTPFQIKVWQELLNVKYGKTRTYKEQALALNNLKAIRAVATANGANPIPIVIPCHRIIGSDSSLTGFSGGLWRKKFLLDLESNQTSLF